MQSVAFEYGDTGWGYGFGWSVFRSGDLKVVGHAGGMVGLSTYSLFIPDEQVGVVVLTNRSEASSFTLAEQLLGVMRGAPIWRDSVGQPLPFESRFRWSENLSLTCYDGDYVHAGVTSRIRAVGDDLRFKLIRNGVEISEDVATHVGDETFLSRGTATIMQFIRDEHGKGKILLEGGLIFHRQDDSVD
jgi:CubicO group peptidase (beta-lactamase class C family)